MNLNQNHKSPEAIEREIDAQRASIGNIVDALESKFTPGQMFDQALGLMQNNGTMFLSNLGATTENISHAVHDVGDRLVRSTHVMSNQFSHLLKEQPLMVAAAGIALGAMLGAALPSTTTEQRYLGKTSAGLADKVKQQAREGFEAVRDTVTKTTGHFIRTRKSDRTGSAVQHPIRQPIYHED